VLLLAIFGHTPFLEQLPGKAGISQQSSMLDKKEQMT
jgi:hypothetical protein